MITTFPLLSRLSEREGEVIYEWQEKAQYSIDLITSHHKVEGLWYSPAVVTYVCSLGDPYYVLLAHGHPFVCGHLQDLGEGLTTQWAVSQTHLCASLNCQMIHDLLYGLQGPKASCHLACEGNPINQHCFLRLASLWTTFMNKEEQEKAQKYKFCYNNWNFTVFSIHTLYFTKHKWERPKISYTFIVNYIST